jgi:periplasmic protein TonB
MLTSNASALRRAPTSLALVGAVHLVVLWALLNGLNIHITPQALPRDMVASVIDRPQPPPEKTTLPQAQITEIKFTQNKIEEIPIDHIELDMPPQVIDTGASVALQGPERGGSAEPKVVITGASVDPRHPLSQPSYPMEARHFGEQGKVLLAILVGRDGRVVDAKATQSSGSERLDQAAIKEARQHWRLRPAQRDGVPFAQWLTVPVVFRLEQR